MKLRPDKKKVQLKHFETILYRLYIDYLQNDEMIKDSVYL